MKKLTTFLVMFTVLALVLVACGKQNDTNNNDGSNQVGESNLSNQAELAYPPAEINPDVDVCHVCAMAIADDQHATQIMLKNKRSLKFDDLGCLYAWIEENGKDEIGAAFVRDFHTKEWILLEDATFVFDEEIETPMAYGIISFAEMEDAEKYIEENGWGKLLTVSDLDDHKWEMMNHDHDHEHGHDHGDEEHDQGHEDHDDGHETHHEHN